MGVQMRVSVERSVTPASWATSMSIFPMDGGYILVGCSATLLLPSPFVLYTVDDPRQVNTVYRLPVVWSDANSFREFRGMFIRSIQRGEGIEYTSPISTVVWNQQLKLRRIVIEKNKEPKNV